MKNLIIIGVGGLAREVSQYARSCLGYKSDWELKGFLDGNIQLPRDCYKLLDFPLLGNSIDYKIQHNDAFVCAIADVNVRKLLVKNIQNRGGEFVNLIHNTSIISNRVKMGNGIILCPYTTVGCNSTLGDHVIINYFSSIGHDAYVGDYSSVMAHVDLTGNVYSGECTYWGSGSRALPYSRIETHATTGAGSVILKEVKKGKTVVGVPARPI